MRLTALAVVALVASVGPAWAGGGGSIRELSSTNLGDCPGGKLMEHYHEYGNIHGDSEEIQVACINSPTHAIWLWMAATECEGSKVCPRRRRPPAPFAYPSGHFLLNKPDGQSSPKTMTYNVKQAIRGKDCALQSYIGEFESEYFWSCTNYKTLYDTDQPIIAVTVGPAKQVDDGEDGAVRLPLQLTAPASTYTVNEATPLIDVQ